jgi:hypothetical protein
MSGKENDRQGYTKVAQPTLQFRTVHSWYPNIKKNAARFAVVWKPFQELLGRRIGCHLIAG